MTSFKSTISLTPRMVSVIVCLIADQLGIDRNRVYSLGGVYCYLLDGNDKTITISNTEKSRLLEQEIDSEGRILDS